jgi:hypothetical protein
MTDQQTQQQTRQYRVIVMRTTQHRGTIIVRAVDSLSAAAVAKALAIQDGHKLPETDRYATVLAVEWEG